MGGDGALTGWCFFLTSRKMCDSMPEMAEPRQKAVRKLVPPSKPVEPKRFLGGRPIDITEPSYQFWEVAVICGFPTLNSLYQYLHKHPEITRHYREGNVRWHGYLYKSQVEEIKLSVFHDKEDSPFARAGRPRKRMTVAEGWVGRIVKAACQ